MIYKGLNMRGCVTEEDVDELLNNIHEDLIERIKEYSSPNEDIDDVIESIKQKLYYPINGDDIVLYVQKKGASDEIVEYAKLARKRTEEKLIKKIKDLFE